MKLTNLLIFLIVFVSLFSIPTFAQKNITDLDFSDVINIKCVPTGNLAKREFDDEFSSPIK